MFFCYLETKRARLTSTILQHRKMYEEMELQITKELKRIDLEVMPAKHLNGLPQRKRDVNKANVNLYREECERLPLSET